MTRWFPAVWCGATFLLAGCDKDAGSGRGGPPDQTPVSVPAGPPGRDDANTRGPRPAPTDTAAQAGPPQVGSGYRKAAPPPYQSPQQAGEALIAATNTKDWGATFRCFAPEFHDLLVAQLIANVQFAAIHMGDKTIDAVFKKHGFDPEKAEAAANELARPAIKEKKEPDWRKVIAVYVAAIKDKEAFFGDVLRWADERYSGGLRVPPDKVKLQDLTVTGDTATAKLFAGSGEGRAVSFKKVGDVWFVLPADRYGRGLTKSFLVDHLDVIHGWRF